jgi:hypothetical protein
VGTPPGIGPVQPGSPAAPYTPPALAGPAALALSPAEAPPQASSGAGTKILGGCGIAGCLGIVFVGIVGIALVIVFMVSRPSSSSVSSSDPGGEPGGSSGSSGSSEVPSSGALKELVRQQIGPYQLLGAGRPDKLPSPLMPGLQDSLGLNYTASGVRVAHVMCAYASSSTSNERLDAILGNVDKQPLRDRQGRQYGRGGVARGGDLQMVVWTNGPTLFVAVAPPPHALKFHEKTPY